MRIATGSGREHPVTPSLASRRNAVIRRLILCANAARQRHIEAYAAATLRATSNNSSGIGTESPQVNATGRSPRWST